jgi:hypothetical protein
MDEEYKPIHDLDNYEISNLGNVRNRTNGEIRKAYTNSQGYLEIKLCKNGIYKCKRLHRLIAEAFIENPEKKILVEHIDNNKFNNKIENLRWVNHSKSMNSKNTLGNSFNNKDITFFKKDKNYKIQIKFNCENLGFNGLEEEARKNKTKELFDKFC